MAIFRKDLKESAIGDGDHAFIFNCEQRLIGNERSSVLATVVKSDGSYEKLRSHLPGSLKVAAEAKQQLQFDELVSDDTQRPVFVLGAARSETSAMAQALLKLDRFKGHQEGHLLDLLAHWSVSLDKFYVEKADDALVDRDTMLSIVPLSFFESVLDNVFLKTIRAGFQAANRTKAYLTPNLKLKAQLFLAAEANCCQKKTSNLRSGPLTCFRAGQYVNLK